MGDFSNKLDPKSLSPAELLLTARTMEVDLLRQQKDDAYSERNKLVALVAHFTLSIGGLAWLAQHPDDPNWDSDWRTIVFVVLPNGSQLTWHIHDSERELFDFLPDGPNTWDGHDTATKYARVYAFIRRRKPKLNERTNHEGGGR